MYLQKKKINVVFTGRTVNFVLLNIENKNFGSSEG